MNMSTVKKLELDRELSMFPDEKLDDVKTFLDDLLLDTQKKTSSRNLKGIWKGKGFDEIDLEQAIQNTRKELDRSILERTL